MKLLPIEPNFKYYISRRKVGSLMVPTERIKCLICDANALNRYYNFCPMCGVKFKGVNK